MPAGKPVQRANMCHVLHRKNLTVVLKCRMMTGMTRKPKQSSSTATTTAKSVRSRIEFSGERVWRLSDFEGLSFTAVAQELSRLYRKGVIQRLGKGLYYRPRTTAFGQSKPNLSQIRSMSIPRRSIFPAGIAAANLLGFSTQNPAKVEVATNGSSLPRLIIGRDTIIHTRRPESWRSLTETEAALLDFLRNRGESSEYTSEETVGKLLEYFQDRKLYNRLLKIAQAEPPRVRAMLGAIGQQLNVPAARLAELRKSLNPLSRFEFGQLIALTHAKEWQAKEIRSRETL